MAKYISGAQGNYRLFCEACEVYLGSKANYAFHILNKEHCENSIKARKTKSEPKSNINKETSSVLEISKAAPITAEHTRSTPASGYGCFIDSKLCRSEAVNSLTVISSYYWSSVAENHLSEKVISASEVMNTKPTTVSPFCKTIIKSLISCEICHVTLTEISDYEYHLNSYEHIRNLELRGMGAAARFVKGDTDSQATNTVEVSTKSHEVQNNNLEQLTPMCENLELIPFPLLYCDACEMLLSTARQFIDHVNAESHILRVQKKDKIKVKEVQLPVPNKYYCFSCQMVLNSSSQFNEHKMGKKHKNKCTQLIAMGILIPPEEQLPEWDLPKTKPDKTARYPVFYERFVLTKQKGELEKSGDLKELQMIENDDETNDCIEPLDVTNGTDTLEETQNLNSFPRHIYIVQNKDSDTYS